MARAATLDVDNIVIYSSETITFDARNNPEAITKIGQIVNAK